ncbi:DgyrCDS4799 [Dimorphilus gyrociliatus]|uniref:Homologous-pairing protein 2 homolog n=1 Tax=Dimorphilus gyrociliatus TaxID=2664684 RepID=A0A7I8VJG4_9ANNE|nr:DgyrCDS4799 [Dimorphilus gyrociliatus]
MAKPSAKETSDGILQYITQQNRPYSATDIFNNLHGKFGKTAVVKALESLAADGKLVEKIYGKQKVYGPNQDSMPSIPPDELVKMRQKVAELQRENEELTKNEKKLDMLISEKRNAIPTNELKQKVQDYQKQLQDITKRVDSCKNNPNAVSAKDMEKIKKERNKFLAFWRKRRRIANDILDAMLESGDKKKSELMEELGIETDEDYNVNIQTFTEVFNMESSSSESDNGIEEKLRMAAITIECIAEPAKNNGSKRKQKSKENEISYQSEEKSYLAKKLEELLDEKIKYVSSSKNTKKDKSVKKDSGVRIYPKGPKVFKVIYDEEIPQKRKKRKSTSTSSSDDENLLRDVAVSGYDILKQSSIS